jgi:Cys-tRNA(Pro)/Cys-tRNA(Cys) deacylase
MAKETPSAKTNAMRLLDQAGIEYSPHGYDENDGKIDGISVADKIGFPYEQVFKTLLAQGPGGNLFVFVLPVNAELDLKKAAKAAGEKSIVMAPGKDLLKHTGYIHGGCSPIGMKRLYPTFIDESAILLETMVFSAGRIGAQIEAAPDDLLQLVQAEYVDLSK